MKASQNKKYNIIYLGNVGHYVHISFFLFMFLIIYYKSARNIFTAKQKIDVWIKLRSTYRKAIGIFFLQSVILSKQKIKLKEFFRVIPDKWYTEDQREVIFNFYDHLSMSASLNRIVKYFSTHFNHNKQNFIVSLN